jgi:serine/threonine protein phosphatase PrpC
MANQDAFECVQNPEAGISAVVVADGIGSHYGAESASHIAVKTVAERLREAAVGDAIDMRGLFIEAWQKILEYACENPPPAEEELKDSYGTTLLCAIETSEQIVLGYAGNGAIFHIRGNFNTFPAQQLLPWTALNYLNPHSVPQHGRAALSRMLSLKAQPYQVEPTVLTLNKDCHQYGDIILCCTDGICSYDQAVIGYDEKQEIWVHAEPALHLLFASLSAFFRGPVENQGLTSCLEAFLQDIDAKRLMEDDCTVALFITGKALEYQAAMHSSKMEGVLA